MHIELSLTPTFDRTTAQTFTEPSVEVAVRRWCDRNYAANAHKFGSQFRIFASVNRGSPHVYEVKVVPTPTFEINHAGRYVQVEPRGLVATLPAPPPTTPVIMPVPEPDAEEDTVTPPVTVLPAAPQIPEDELEKVLQAQMPAGLPTAKADVLRPPKTPNGDIAAPPAPNGKLAAALRKGAKL